MPLQRTQPAGSNASIRSLQPSKPLPRSSSAVIATGRLHSSQRRRASRCATTHSIDEAIVLADRIMVMTARPGRIKDIIDVDAVFGRPRRVEALKSSKEYGELFGRVWGQLRDEVNAARRLQDAQRGQS